MGEPEPARQEGRLRGNAAIRLHLTLVGGLTLAAGAFAFEVVRALGGNELSWVYVFEWPFLGGFGIYMWWKLYNGTSPRPRTAGQPAATRSMASAGIGTGRGTRAGPAGEDKDLAAWHAYLHDLEAKDRAAAAPEERPTP